MHGMSRMQKVAGLVGWLVVTGLAAFAGSVASRRSQEFYGTLIRPEWAPPPEVFGPVWTVLYVLIAISATLAYRDVGGPRRRIVLGLYAANLALNLAWTWIFFQGHRPTAAGVEILFLLGTIVALIALVFKHNRAAAAALAPYGAWTAFATALTWTIAVKN